MQKHTIFGAGLIGGFLGGVLTSLGLTTTLVCRPSIKKKLERGLLLTDYLDNKAIAKQLHLVNNDPLFGEIFDSQPCDFLWITVKCTAIEQASKEIKNVEFKDRLRRIVREARAILDTIEEDPTDARRARKFLKVYLDGAKQVTEGYVKAHRNDANPVLEDNFRRVLTTIETVIATQQEKLRENNVSELDVNIEVLQLQIEKEGVA